MDTELSIISNQMIWWVWPFPKLNLMHDGLRKWGEISAIYCNREGGMQFYCIFLRILTHCVRQNGKFCPPGFWYRDEGGYSSWGSIEPISFDGGSHQCWGRFEAKNRCLPSLSHFSQAGIHLSLSLYTLQKFKCLCLMNFFLIEGSIYTRYPLIKI